MKIVLCGGSGQIGQILSRAWTAAGHEIVVASRGGAVPIGRLVSWDGRSGGEWEREIDGADVVVNLAGRSVNCRYTPENTREMMTSRVLSTEAVGRAVAAAARPPRLWLQMSTATIYAHRFDAPNDEATGIIGGHEAGVPGYWSFSVEIARAWEAALQAARTPSTRKVALRASMVMSPDRGGVFDAMLGLVRSGLGGSAAGGRQYVSWIHHEDFVAALDFIAEREELSGPINVCSPNPLPYRDFMAALRDAWGVSVGLPATRWMLEAGAFIMRTDTELVLKSRRVVPGRLLQSGFSFRHPEWREAARHLAWAWREGARNRVARA